MITLRGISWDHTRGFVSKVATSQRFHELHPEVEIVWEKRSLQNFADFPVPRLAETFDILDIDHPSVGEAMLAGALLPLDDFLPSGYLDDQAAYSVGASHASYQFGGCQWALAVDAAAPVAAWRPDLLEAPPQTWDELMELARAGRVALPAIPVDSLMNFYPLCIRLGETPFLTPERVVTTEIGIDALEMLRTLVSLCDPVCLTRNPIRTFEAMVAGDDIHYCPFAYGYSNYARDGYARRRLQFGGLVRMADGQRLNSTLGGTGLAVSRTCAEREWAVKYIAFAGSGETQRGLYFQSGGQPGHRSAWTDPAVNAACHNYFADTLPTLDAAFLRPRYPGHLGFQDAGGTAVHDFLCGKCSAAAALERMNHIYRESLAHATP